MSARQLQPLHYLLVAMFAGGVVAAVGFSRSPAPAATPEPVPPPVAVAPQPQEISHGGGPAEAPQAPAGRLIDGEVLEVADAGSYTYARIGQKGTEGVWAAFPATKLAVGSKIRVRAEMEMKDFDSTALKRKFPSVWFGVLDDGAAGSDPHAGSAPPAPTPAASVVVQKLERAPGGKTVAEVWAERTQLAGKTVKIRGTVVKSTAAMGKTYLHVRDGSGDAKDGSNDLTVTTTATADVGSTVIVEGVVALDRDIGSGYKWATLVENATITPQ